MKNTEAERQIEAIIQRRVKAIKDKNIEAATAGYASDLVLFDIVGPLSHRGSGSVKERLKEWFGTFDSDAAVNFEMTDITVTADEALAFSHSFNHIDAALKDGNKLDMWWRETQNWTKINGSWNVVHTHSSVPFDPQTGKPSLNLKPGEPLVKVDEKPVNGKIVKNILEAYQNKNKALVEALLDDTFTFTSPQDDHINKAAYFERCWPFSQLDPVYQILKIVPEGDDVFLLYQCEAKGKKFRNTEFFRLKNNKILSVEVFFGKDLT